MSHRMQSTTRFMASTQLARKGSTMNFARLLTTIAALLLAPSVAPGQSPDRAPPDAVGAEPRPATDAGATAESAPEAAPAPEVAPQPDAEAEPAPDALRTEPTVLHRPALSARAGKVLKLGAEVVGDWRLSAVEVHYRPAGAPGGYTVVPFARSTEGGWQARIPSEAVRSQGLEYFVASTGTDGAARQHFASAEDPHPVRVIGEAPADTMADQLARYDGHRSRLTLVGELHAYGPYERTDRGLPEPDRVESLSDHYWRAEATYIYRPLEVLHDFRFGVGLMRAEWPEVDGAAIEAGETPGINYAFGEINFELHRWFSLGGRLVLGASSEGFVAGFGAIARVGDIAGTHLASTVETIGDVGTRTDLRFHWTTIPRVPMALGIEFTDWPSDQSATDAANLSLDVGYELDDRWTITGRIGSAKRSSSLSTGVQAALGLHRDF